MRFLPCWTILLTVTVVTLGTFGQAPIVTNELLPWLADNGVVTWQELYDPRRTDMFQPSALFPVSVLPTPNIGLRAFDSANPNTFVAVSNAGRPQVSADGRWLVFYQADTTTNPPTAQVYVKDMTDPNAAPRLISYKGWTDTDNDNIRDGAPTPSSGAVLPAISGSGRIVVFLSQDGALNDPKGDGAGTPAPAPPPGRWLIYIHDRDADNSGSFDDAKVGGTTTRFLPDPSDPTGNTPLFVRLTEVRLSLDATGRALAFSVFTGTAWQLWYVPDVQSPTPTLIAQSNAPFSTPSLAGSRLAFTASGAFQFTATSQPSPPGVYVVDNTTNQSIALQTNGVNGAPALSRDGNLLALHSTMTAYRMNGGNWVPFPNKRNAVEDVFAFDLATGQLVWSTLALRQANPNQFPPYAPCVNPTLPSSSVNLIAFQQIVNGQSRVRIVNTATSAILR